ncbi:DEAD/DEAH box helicase [Zhihengliuella halotolerans]|uniref:DEAD/DEAH box helicase n=1 Tax=Zhihengliuella halotolerans TaxID=370736 RepID=UPI000C806EEB|nr:type ISP restriction/modification enzyme [Zhihengliuella halotolerans]
MTTSTFADVLDAIYWNSETEHAKGKSFERMMKRFLQLEPKYADLFSEVWLWDEWPNRNRRPDTGVDLVARDRYTGELTAIQCKFYDPAHKLDKRDFSTFLAELNKNDFAQGMVVSTASFTSHAEAALDNLTKQVTRFGLNELEHSTVDWTQFSLEQPEIMIRTAAKHPRKYQQEAIGDVIAGFETSDRGKLIMACGTGKTFTSLKLVEQMVPVGGSVLFLVPSIALLQQTLNEWTGQADVRLKPLAVCSDTKVGKRYEDEDISVHDLGYPASTDPTKLLYRAKVSTGQEAITVVFSTYQSLDVVRQAQEAGLPEFDLVICDEAHRTTGHKEAGSEGSNFTMVHDETKIKAAKRLFMTATPRIYVQESKTKAAEDNVEIFSMDDAAKYGPEFHHLGFGQAVEMGHLSDYKVLVLAVDESSVAKSFQSMFEEDGDLNLDDVARVVGCWNGLSKRSVNGERLAITDHAPMRRAVAFARNIKESKALAGQFEKVSTQLGVSEESALRMEAQHVDGTFNMADRTKRLQWLTEPTADNTCRILTNARCLTEGVDVPSLDSVLFLNPRNSQVDVVQAVGRVMRKAPGKEYGYIILPIAVPADQDPETALNDNKRYRVVWDVLQALRAHDDRFEAAINKIDLDRGANKVIDVIGIGGGNQDGPLRGSDAPDFGTDPMFFDMDAEAWRNAIFARMVRKVGDRRYWEDWAKNVKEIADRHTLRIQAILDGDDHRPREEFEVFLEGLRGNLNASITENDAIGMLSQHLITKPVFDALFEDYSFTAHNPVSRVMDDMLTLLNKYNLDSELETLEDFYRSVRVRAEGIDSAEGKQRIITELYERFFKLAFPKTAESLGIVYTPVEVVDFILRAVNDVLKKEFGASISDEGVHVLDPFTGTGTFIVRLLQSGLIKPDDLLRKYTQELHANELLLMAYYVAAVNIEATLHGLLEEAERDAALLVGREPRHQEYVPFDGIVLTDTFQMTEDGDTLDEHVFTSNNERVVAQNKLDIRVIVGNPPYSVGQTSGNDNNANLGYPTLDGSIRETYARLSTAQNKNSLYDSYIRAIRWASDRVLNNAEGGVICFVSNGGYLDGNTADGLRKALYSEFHEIYIYNLRGNQRTAGEQSRKEGGKVFGSGSRNTVAVLLLVKRPGPVDDCRLNYKDVGDYLSREEKLSIVDEASLSSLDWQQITPNANGDWINQRDESFGAFAPLSAKDGKNSIFASNGAGLQTNRDAWVYSSSEAALTSNVGRTIDYFNAGVEVGEQDMNPAHVSWSSSLTALHEKATRLDSDRANEKSVGTYRPFNKQHVTRVTELIHRPAALKRYWPTQAAENYGFYQVGAGSAVPFSVLMTDALPDLHVTGAGSGGQFFPRYTYAPVVESEFFEADASSAVPGYTRIDNITDSTLKDYRAQYGTEVSKDDVFFYVYGLLHSPDYRERYAADLRKMLPRIPKVVGAADFRAFSEAGRQLSDLHIGYEAVEPYPLLERELTAVDEPDNYKKYAVTKMKYGGKSGAWDKSTIKFNAYVSLEGIPEESQPYMLGSRSALDWIIERYQVKTDKASGIVNDPNDWSREHEQPRYIIDLIGRIVTVSLETNRIVEELPVLKID